MGSNQQHTSTPSSIAAVARGATYLWLAVSAINFIVWLAVSAVSGKVDGPWFLYAFGAGGVVVAGLRLAARARPHAAAPTTTVRTAAAPAAETIRSQW